MFKRILTWILALSLLCGLPALAAGSVKLSDDAGDFVLLSEAVPDAILEIRYYSTYNFVGERIDGYEEPLAFLTREAAEALRAVSDDVVAQGYRLKIYDAYRPQMAVTHFVNWAKDADDARMKAYFYPDLAKDALFPQGYIAEHSGHSRGSTVDLTLFDMTTEKEVDMGGTFDFFGEQSHPDYRGITDEQYANRMILRKAMLAHGFKALSTEWWHFTLKDEPYPDTYFTFPVNSDSVAPAAHAAIGASDAPGAEALAEGYFRVLSTLEVGTAGASLKAAAAAAEVYDFAATRELWDPEMAALPGNMRAAWDALAEDEREAFRQGFDAICALLDAAFDDYAANRPAFEDAGWAETMDARIDDALARLAWERLRGETEALAM